MQLLLISCLLLRSSPLKVISMSIGAKKKKKFISIIYIIEKKENASKTEDSMNFMINHSLAFHL